MTLCAIDHDLHRVRQEVLVLERDLSLELLDDGAIEIGHIAEIVDPHDRHFRFRILQLLDQTHDSAVLLDRDP